MISKETFSKIASLSGMKPWQQEKHYFQSLMLQILCEHQLVFKGGTYLWLLHGLPRFSEDLDFTALGEIPDDLGKQVSEGLELFGAENKLKMISNDQRSHAFRISAKGPLYTSDMDLCHVYVEISKRERPTLPTLPCALDFAQYSLPTKTLQGLSLEEAGAEKVRAILTRDKARDLFDLHYLIKRKKIRYREDLISGKMLYYQKGFSPCPPEKNCPFCNDMIWDN